MRHVRRIFPPIAVEEDDVIRASKGREDHSRPTSQDPDPLRETFLREEPFREIRVVWRGLDRVDPRSRAASERHQGRRVSEAAADLEEPAASSHRDEEGPQGRLRGTARIHIAIRAVGFAVRIRSSVEIHVLSKGRTENSAELGVCVDGKQDVTSATRWSCERKRFSHNPYTKPVLTAARPGSVG